MIGKRILIVGSSSVIGKALAARFTASGASVISAGRSGDYSVDLTSRESIANFLAQMKGTSLDGVVVASGAVAFGAVGELPAPVTNELMQVNFLGPVEVIGGLIENLKGGSEPFVVTLSGKIAEIPTAGMAAYSAAKSALQAYSVAAAREVRRAGIRWIDARPGHTETGFADRAIFGQAPAFGSGLTAEFVAGRIFDAILSGEKDLPSTAFEG